MAMESESLYLFIYFIAGRFVIGAWCSVMNPWLPAAIFILSFPFFFNFHFLFDRTEKIERGGDKKM